MGFRHEIITNMIILSWLGVTELQLNAGLVVASYLAMIMTADSNNTKIAIIVSYIIWHWCRLISWRWLHFHMFISGATKTNRLIERPIVWPYWTKLCSVPASVLAQNGGAGLCVQPMTRRRCCLVVVVSVVGSHTWTWEGVKACQ